MADKAHLLADFQLLLGQNHAVLMALLPHLLDAQQELLLGGGLHQDVVEQLRNAWKGGQGLVTALVPPVSGVGEAHRCYLVVKLPLRMSSSGGGAEIGRWWLLCLRRWRSWSLSAPNHLLLGGGGGALHVLLVVGVQADVGDLAQAVAYATFYILPLCVALAFDVVRLLAPHSKAVPLVGDGHPAS